jgi:hypothetical protein
MAGANHAARLRPSLGDGFAPSPVFESTLQSHPMKLKPFALFFAGLVLTNLAHADNADLDSQKKETQAKVQKTREILQTSCGCDVQFDVDYNSFENREDLSWVNLVITHPFQKKGSTYCVDAASKAAICKIKTFKYSRAKETTTTISGGTATLTTDGRSSDSWDTLIKRLNKPAP